VSNSAWIVGSATTIAAWTVTAFYIPFAAMLIAGGRIADVFGRRLTLIDGISRAPPTPETAIPA
jgi:MFS family permease